MKKVAVIMGSVPTGRCQGRLQPSWMPSVPYEAHILSAHRTPAEAAEFAGAPVKTALAC